MGLNPYQPNASHVQKSRIGRIHAPISDLTTAIGHASGDEYWLAAGEHNRTDARKDGLRQTDEAGLWKYLCNEDLDLLQTLTLTFFECRDENPLAINSSAEKDPSEERSTASHHGPISRAGTGDDVSPSYAHPEFGEPRLAVR